ncbi:hypothetical protein Tco_0161985 [Tanacetum coccineum]
MKIEESLNVTFDETPPLSKTSSLVDDDLDEEEAIKVTKKKILENDIEDETLEIDEVVNIKESRDHPLENVIGNLKQRTLRQLRIRIMVILKDQHKTIVMPDFDYAGRLETKRSTSGICMFVGMLFALWFLEETNCLLAISTSREGEYVTSERHVNKHYG